MTDAPGDDRELGRLLLDIVREAATPSAALRAHGLIERIPEFAVLADTPQDPVWHPEGDVLVHSLWAADLAAAHAAEHALEPEHRERLVFTTLVHDIGKPETTYRRDGRIVSPGHAERGAEIIATLGARLGTPPALIDAAAAITANHMVHYAVRGEPTPRAVHRLIERLAQGGATLADWSVVVRCDSAARGSAARPDPSAAWMRVAGDDPVVHGGV